MKNSTPCKKEDLQRSSFHSQICIASHTDLIYTKAYKGDWGHWDDLPENDIVNQNHDATIENIDTAVYTENIEIITIKS